MRKNRVSCCYFPTTVFFLDDKLDYLKNLRVGLDRNLAYQFHTDPKKLLSFFEKDYQFTPFISRWMSNIKDTQVELGRTLEQTDLTHTYIDIDIAGIHHEIYSPNRFDEISVIVIDYSMPKMNGINFAKTLRAINPHIKILMLTGVATHQIGIQAFNESIIDQFVLKGDIDFYERLNQAIYALQHQYFNDLSQPIIQNLITSPSCCLSDLKFIKFFKQFCQTHHICEYYIVNDSGCFLMLSLEGKPSWLIVKSEQDMQRYTDIAKDNDGPADIIQVLQKREKVLFHLTEDDARFNKIEDWKKYLHSAKTWQGQKYTYHYAYLEGPTVYNIQPEKIISYQSYLVNK